jgi:hypothetical protein
MSDFIKSISTVLESAVNKANDALYSYVLIILLIGCILGKYVFRALRDFERKTKLGGNVEFNVSDIGLPHDVDCWN